MAEGGPYLVAAQCLGEGLSAGVDPLDVISQALADRHAVEGRKLVSEDVGHGRVLPEDELEGGKAVEHGERILCIHCPSQCSFGLHPWVVCHYFLITSVHNTMVPFIDSVLPGTVPRPSFHDTAERLAHLPNGVVTELTADIRPALLGHTIADPHPVGRQAVDYSFRLFV